MVINQSNLYTAVCFYKYAHNSGPKGSPEMILIAFHVKFHAWKNGIPPWGRRPPNKILKQKQKTSADAPGNGSPARPCTRAGGPGGMNIGINAACYYGRLLFFLKGGMSTGIRAPCSSAGSEVDDLYLVWNYELTSATWPWLSSHVMIYSQLTLLCNNVAWPPSFNRSAPPSFNRGPY